MINIYPNMVNSHERLARTHCTSTGNLNVSFLQKKADYFAKRPGVNRIYLENTVNFLHKEPFLQRFFNVLMLYLENCN